jgi:DNA repair protein RadC
MELRQLIKEYKDSSRVRFPADSAEEIRKAIEKKYSDRENFVVMCLDGSHSVIKTEVVSIGLVNRVLVHPREVFHLAIKLNSAAVIIGHNHPSGALEPSDEDKQVTKRLKESGEILGIPVLDSLIVSMESAAYYSMLETNEL